MPTAMPIGGKSTNSEAISQLDGLRYQRTDGPLFFARSKPVVRELIRPAPEGRNLGVLDRVTPDVDSPADRLVRVPGRRPGYHCREGRQERFADFPGG